MVKVTIRKIPRDGKLIDHPINFPPLENLHLDLMEVKKKLKPNLPIIPKEPIKIRHKYVFDSDANIIDYDTRGLVVKTGAEHEPPRVFHTGKVEESDDEDGIIAKFGKLRERKEQDNLQFEGHSEDGEAAEEEYEEEDEDAHLSPEEREVKERQEYMWRFKILKKQYKDNKDVKFPEWNEFSDVATMKITYNQTIKELYLDENVKTYKMYLIGGFIATEYIGTQYLGIDLTGFAKMQLVNMAKYERMLIELGEKSYAQWGNNIPVELRLLGTILFQAGIFWMGKNLGSGAGFLQMIMGIQNGVVPQFGNVQAPSDEQPRRRGGMRGPAM